MRALAVLGPLHGGFFNPKEFWVKKLSLTNPKWTSHLLEYNKIVVTQQFLIFILLGRKQEDKSY
jgi:hypothetical protein